MTTREKVPVTRNSLFDIASNAETTLDHLMVLIDSASEKLSNLRRNDSPDVILAQADVTQTFLDAAGLYIKKLEDSIEAVYKQAWSMPSTEDS